MSNRVWVVDDDRSIRWVLERAMSQAGIPITAFASADHAMHHLDDERPIAVITDVRMPGMDGMDFIDRIHDAYPELPVIVMTAHSDLDSAINAYQSGAFEYLPKPFDVDEAIAIVRRAITFAEEAKTPARIPEPEPAQDIIGQAPAMQEVFRAIGRLANSNVTVLIRGASGSGKELVARALHRHSPRANGNFVALNMAAIPRELVESELFGHEKGAFTGANNQRVGRFEQANGGTLFLDEIGDMPPDTQTRLLRVLSNGEFYRVGGHQPIKVNVRIIAATHQDLEERVQDGTFREDLFHRLNVISVHVPTLAERKSDIPLLARHFLDKAAEELGGEPKLIRPEAMEYMTTLAWPGNVRQLENAVERAVVVCDEREVEPRHLPRSLMVGQRPGDEMPLVPGATLRELERFAILKTLEHVGGSTSKAARILGISPRKIQYRLNEYRDADVDARDNGPAVVTD